MAKRDVTCHITGSNGDALYENKRIEIAFAAAVVGGMSEEGVRAKTFENAEITPAELARLWLHFTRELGQAERDRILGMDPIAMARLPVKK